ncbi:MAG: hypothetical protein KAH21_02665, partial [Spirochaetaceae bacterium]|nr:hypothetical protein [Spirochaetaceae bacterium]
ETGFDYGDNQSASDNKLYSKFVVEKPRRTIRTGEENEFFINLENLHQVSRPFFTIVYIYIKNEDTKWVLSIRIDDGELFTDVEYLRQLNKTDYWHPRIIRENWEKYLQHIGE